jgi:hypothetical protein
MMSNGQLFAAASLLVVIKLKGLWCFVHAQTVADALFPVDTNLHFGRITHVSLSQKKDRKATYF